VLLCDELLDAAVDLRVVHLVPPDHGTSARR
jgi:hypothetical protein